MEFCRKCGEAINDSSFCPSCGTPTSKEIAVNTNEPSMGLEEMNRLIVHFEPSRPWHEEFRNLTLEINEREHKLYLFSLIFPILWYILIVWFLSAGQGHKTFIGIVLALLLLGIPADIILVVRHFASKRNKAKLEEAKVKCDEVWDKLIGLYNSYGFCPLEFQYTNPVILDQLYPIIRNGRARTVGDALTILQQDIHNREMEAHAEETARQAKRSADAASKAATAATISAWNTRK